MTTTAAASISAASSTAPASWGELLSGRNAWRSIALTGGVALHAINVHIVTTILPSVVRDIGGLDWYAWNTTLFIVASILGAALSARLLDRLGPRPAYLLALATFSLGTVVCALAPAMAWMLAGRSLQGLGGGLLAALGYALIRIVFEQRLWPRAVAMVSGMWGVATLCGPALGGVFAQTGHWRLAFWVLLPVALGQALIVVGQLERGRHSAASGTTTRVPFGKLGLLLASVLVIAVGGLSQDMAWNAAGVGAGLALGLWAAWLDKHARVRLLPAGSYSMRGGLGPIYASVALLLVGTEVEIFAPYFLQLIHGYPPLMAGYLTAAMAGGWSIASLLSSGRSGAGADRMVRLGPVVITTGLLALALVMPVAGRFPAGLEMGLLGLALAAVGFGVGVGWPHLLTRVMQQARPGEENLASASITTVQLYGMAMGAAVAGLTVQAAGLTHPGGVAGAQHAAAWLFGSFALAPLLAAWLALRITAPANATKG